jgi:broad specificity phosphatase PhoE
MHDPFTNGDATVPTTLYIIRHAQPASQEPDYPGGANPPLGRHGQTQAERAAQQIAYWGIDFLYSSSMARALQTAQPIHERLHVPWYVWPAFSETWRPRWPQLRALATTDTDDASPHLPETPLDAEAVVRYVPLTQLPARYRGICLSQPFPWPDAWWTVLEGETREAAYARAKQAISALWEQHRGSQARIALVCHGAFASVLLTVLTQGPPCDYNRFSHAHAAITRVDLHDEGIARLRFLNYLGHLSPALITEGVDPAPGWIEGIHDPSCEV